LTQNASESSLRAAVKQFGQVKNLVVMGRKRQALIEFADLDSAKKCVEHSKAGKSIEINGAPALFNYSTSNKIDSVDNDSANAKPVLLLNILNPQYTITTHIINRITSTYGKVKRIVVFRKTGLSAMVEFETVEEAQAARKGLNGADIYEGCCTLRISYAKPDTLNVQKNDNESWDYTKDEVNTSGGALLSDPGPSNGLGLEGGSICLVYNLVKEKFNCERLFNLVCLYGNVQKMKFLKNKEGVAMVQLPSAVIAERLVNQLNGTIVFGKRLKVSVSNQPTLNFEATPWQLADGSRSYFDYSKSRNNRFSSADAASKNRTQGPSKFLHFYNAPPKYTDGELNDVFRHAIGKEPKSIIRFPSKTDKSLTGLVEFDNIQQGVEALIMANHTPLRVPESKQPYLFKLCFTRGSAS